MALTPEMRQWLADNREDYEFYLLHAMMHDPVRRSALLLAPVLPTDFRREEYGLVVGALATATKVMQVIGGKVKAPPSVEFMRTYLESAGREEGSDDDVLRGASQLVEALQNPDYTAQHYCVGPYFEGWYGSIRAKLAAKKLNETEVPDVHEAIRSVQTALASAAAASAGDEEDEMEMFLTSEVVERKRRRPTGILGLDLCMNGGWGDGECSLLFSGTGGGKSIVAGQCAWHEASVNNGYPLIVSTELRPREYITRITSAACGIKIPIVQDCENVAQIRAAVSADPSSSFKLSKVESVIKMATERLKIAKVSAEDGLDARAVCEREILRYEDKVGNKPTLIILDWLGTMADVSAGSSSADRAFAWEIAANGLVKMADVDNTGIPTLVLAQAVNDAQLKRVLTLPDIGISKGIGKNMTTVIGVTNTIDTAGIKQATLGKAEMPRAMFLEDQFFCVCKARKGEGSNIPVTRRFLFQKFEQKMK